MGKLEKGKNDIVTLYPRLVKEWHPTKNDDLRIEDVTIGMHKKAWWICEKGHEWQASISNRARKGNNARNCPYCTNQICITGENDIATMYPDLAKQWSSKNHLPASMVMPGTHKKAIWECELGHEWTASVHSRTMGIGCPICSGKIVLEGFNDLNSILPDLALEWHPTKNGDLLPTQVTSASGKKVWWICERGHEYLADVYNRKQGKGCPYCVKYMRTSFPEQAIFYYVKEQFPDAVNSFKEIFEKSMELDVYIPSIKVGIEYDGRAFHNSNANRVRDARKYQICKENGIKLIRIKDNMNFEIIIMSDYTIKMPSEKSMYLNNAIYELGIVLGVKLSPNVDIDKKEILAQYNERKNNLKKDFPNLAAEWDFEKNTPLIPEKISPHSCELVGWICKDCGNRWNARISDRTRGNGKNTNCPVCSRKNGAKIRTQSIVKDRGSLASKHPDILDEWDYSKNTLVDPRKISSGSGTKAWWICRKCGYNWYAAVVKRVNGRGCPCCQNKVAVKGINDLETLYPSIAKEWDYEKNAPYIPSEFVPGSGKKFYWRCENCGNNWDTQILVRTKGCGCPRCSRMKNKVGM